MTKQEQKIMTKMQGELLDLYLSADKRLNVFLREVVEDAYTLGMEHGIKLNKEKK